MTFDPEAATERTDAELVTFGSPMLDAMAADAQRRGRVARAYVGSLNLDATHLTQKLLRAFDFGGAQTAFEPARALMFHHLLFRFRATFQSDEVQEELRHVLVSLREGRLARQLLAELDRCDLTEENNLPCPDAPCIAVEEAYAIARREIAGSLAGTANDVRHAVDARRAQERERLERFYADYEAELTDGADALEPDDPKREKIEARLRSNEIERARRIEELDGRHQVAVHVALVQALWIGQPKLTASCRLTPERGAERSIELVWDPLLSAPEAATCPACGRPTFRFQFDRRGELHCEGCFQG